MDLLETIDALCNHIDDSVDKINSGGCAVFAACMGKRLMQYGEVRIAVGCDDGDTTIDDARDGVLFNTTGEWNENGVFFNHIVVEFKYEGKMYHIDSSGVHKESHFTHLGSFPILDGRLTVAECGEIAGSSEGWNWMFNRAAIPRIQRMVDYGFDQIATC